MKEPRERYFGLHSTKNRLRGNLSDVCPLLCDRWCSLRFLKDMTGETSGEIMREIKALGERYVVEDIIAVERGDDFMGASVGAPARFWRIISPR